MEQKNLLPQPFPGPVEYCRWSDVFRSWFWRYYDHLFHLILINLTWFLACFGAGVLFWRLELSKNREPSDMPGFVHLYLDIYGVYLIECVISIGWAFVVFKIFNEGGWTFSDFRTGIRSFFWKAAGVSALSGLISMLLLAGTWLFYFYLPRSPFWYLFAGLVLWILLLWFSSLLYQWPVLFFQDPPFFKIFYRSGILAMAHGLGSLFVMLLFVACAVLFTPILVPWFFLGPVFFFSIQCAALEKHLLRYKITYGGKPLGPFLEILDSERTRGWRDFLRPWENR